MLDKGRLPPNYSRSPAPAGSPNLKGTAPGCHVVGEAQAGAVLGTTQVNCKPSSTWVPRPGPGARAVVQSVSVGTGEQVQREKGSQTGSTRRLVRREGCMAQFVQDEGELVLCTWQESKKNLHTQLERRRWHSVHVDS